MEEKWEPIPGYEHLYLASSIGRIKSIFYNRRGREVILKPSLDHRGYPQVVLVNGDKKVTKKIHKLVLMAFMPNPENKPCVNHINGVKIDNRLENLEWCTQKENVRHSYDVLKITNGRKGKKGNPSPLRRKVKQIDIKSGAVIKIWDSMTHTEQIGLNVSRIWSACNGKNKSAGGYRWEYA